MYKVMSNKRRCSFCSQLPRPAWGCHPLLLDNGDVHESLLSSEPIAAAIAEDPCASSCHGQAGGWELSLPTALRGDVVGTSKLLKLGSAPATELLALLGRLFRQRRLREETDDDGPAWPVERGLLSVWHGRVLTAPSTSHGGAGGSSNSSGNSDGRQSRLVFLPWSLRSAPTAFPIAPVDRVDEGCLACLRSLPLSLAPALREIGSGTGDRLW
mmetsp:Transcript_20205/g.47134  ORF Transcript_20205/g.47134 Transcript_20205/m.47134 type:complete len:213 (+) Transcript_20205:1273-1911(+)